ncbi:endogenous retrovirus group S71 member 1 Env polyprotein-like [Pteropus medius]|uniref:endogenous retrovirus group S71 member 1 Env polyprotein-like n=1 Tax=Pteropus vampyrus TaxID=132908 RepID=UPI00196BA179|nr:endogenous retrovirus group S71 member 1 Env polyprotein-like [Pteropus giganteus]XP_039703509.1 endogenous retrovirus group S71 member 1 Env polyprotein-like [Pteropus giganteus]
MDKSILAYRENMESKVICFWNRSRVTQTIQKKPVKTPIHPIEPNSFLNPSPYRPRPKHKVTTPAPSQGSTHHAPRKRATPNTPQDSILKMLTAVYKFANTSNPNITDDCWLCLNPASPYYVGLGAVAVLGSNEITIRNLSAPNITVCPWRKHPKLTLVDLQGQGTCIHTSSYHINNSTYRENCNTTIRVNSTSNNYLAAPKGTWFACNTGLTPCINLNYWRENAGFCVLVHVIPQVYFYSGERGREYFQYLGAGVKRAPILVPLLVGIGVAGSTAVGTAALVTRNSKYKALSQQINEDLLTLEKSINHLETSLNSLAEVVLQNRRGLDLLFLKQGGLCIALGETCCFYANHSGIM